MRGLDVRSRVIVSNHAAKAALRERRGTHEAAHRVVMHVPSAPPELRVMMSIPTIFNPNLNGMEPIPDFLPRPNETVGFKCAPRLPRLIARCTAQTTSQRCPRSLSPPALSRRHVASSRLLAATLMNSQLQGRRCPRLGLLRHRLPRRARRRPEPARSTQVPKERQGDGGCRAGRGPDSISDPPA